MTTMTQTMSKEAAYGWFADAIGGTAAAVLAIIGLAGVHSEMMVAIATIIFGAALLIEGGTMLSEYAQFSFPPGQPLQSPMNSAAAAFPPCSRQAWRESCWAFSPWWAFTRQS